MTYVTIDETTANGKKIMAELRRMRKGVIIHEKLNAETKEALREAKSGIGVEKVKDFSKWINKVWEEQ